jgi:hypothetical protein
MNIVLSKCEQGIQNWMYSSTHSVCGHTVAVADNMVEWCGSCKVIYAI